MGRDREDPARELRNVVDLTDEDFYDVVGQDNYVLLEVYAPWCGHCREMVKTYGLLGGVASSHPQLKDKVVIAKMNGEMCRRAAKRYDIQGFPTLLLFEPHKTTPKAEYEGGRSVNELIDYLLKQVK